MTNKEKQNLRYMKVCQRLNKKRYKGLTDEAKEVYQSKRGIRAKRKSDG